MNGLDTNVLIRYLVVDDKAQAAKAKRYIESGTCHIDCIVLSEVVWVLESAYGYDTEAIVRALERLLAIQALEVEEADLALAAPAATELRTLENVEQLAALARQARDAEQLAVFTLTAQGVPGSSPLVGMGLCVGAGKAAYIPLAHRSLGAGPQLPIADFRSVMGPLLEDLHTRLAGVVIECLPYGDFIRRYDRPATMFYIDPPYWGCEKDYGQDLFEAADFEETMQLLRCSQPRAWRPAVRLLGREHLDAAPGGGRENQNHCRHNL